jgi:hypothetical protein
MKRSAWSSFGMALAAAFLLVFVAASVVDRFASTTEESATITRTSTRERRVNDPDSNRRIKKTDHVVVGRTESGRRFEFDSRSLYDQVDEGTQVTVYTSAFSGRIVAVRAETVEWSAQGTGKFVLIVFVMFGSAVVFAVAAVALARDLGRTDARLVEAGETSTFWARPVLLPVAGAALGGVAGVLVFALAGPVSG